MTAPITYWLAVSAGTNTAAFGWKSTTNQLSDASVFGHVAPDGITAIPAIGNRCLIRGALPPGKLDLAFALTTGRRGHNPPPPPPPEMAGNPDTNGFDVNATFPNIIADDFL